MSAENENNPNETARDAYARMDSARWDSLREESTMEYLFTLQSEVRDWLKTIDFEITVREKDRKK